jgi:hypothetical protein
MVKKNGIKCIANTLKLANHMRDHEEVGQCTHFAIENSRFCDKHQNLNSLTDQQFLNNTKICRFCRKHKYFADMSYHVCDDDLELKVVKRGRIKSLKTTYTPCVICGFTEGNERKYPDYCNKHTTDGCKVDIESRGFKWCKGIIRGCPNPELPKDYAYERCDYCRTKENKQDKERRQSQSEVAQPTPQISVTQPTPQIAVTQPTPQMKPKIQIKLKPLNQIQPEAKIQPVPTQSTTESINIDRIYMVDGMPQKICTSRAHHCLHPLDVFLSDKGTEYYENWKQTHDETHIELYDVIDYMAKHFMIKRQCLNARQLHHEIDQLRDRSDRDYAEYERRPEVIQKRQLWKTQNIDKCRIYWQKYRANKILTDQEGYLKHNAEIQKAYRKTHPETFAKMYEDAKKNVVRRESTYRQSAGDRRIIFNLTSEQCVQLFNGVCFYCGQQVVDGILNGIDRLDNDGEYTIDNCVTACSVCNYMKDCLDPLVFIDICEHILTHVGKIDGILHPHAFTDFRIGKSVKSVYNSYKYRANKKNFELLSFDDFSKFIHEPCYTCGKLTTIDGHTNGIDRYNNELGYNIQNCRPCCGTCNYLKGKLDYDTFIDKLNQIYEHNHIKKIIEDFDKDAKNEGKVSRADYLRTYRLRKGITKTPHIHKTSEEKTERDRLRKQIYRQKKKEESLKFFADHTPI